MSQLDYRIVEPVAPAVYFADSTALVVFELQVAVSHSGAAPLVAAPEPIAAPLVAAVAAECFVAEYFAVGSAVVQKDFVRQTGAPVCFVGSFAYTKTSLI